jgi:hypothetical protein
MSDQNNDVDLDVEIPLGLPFVGGSDDPTELIGIESDGSQSGESGDPGV